MNIFLIFVDALEATYLSEAYREIIQKYDKRAIVLGTTPRQGEKLILESNTRAAYFEVVDVVHRTEKQGRFQVDLYLKATLPPFQP